MALPDCVNRGLAWRDGQLIDDDLSAEELSTVAQVEGTVAWVDLLRPSRGDLAELATKLDLAPTTIEDVVEPHERPKVTRHGQTLFFTVYATSLHADDSSPGIGRLATHRLSGLVLPHLLVTIRLDGGFDFAPVASRWEENADLLRSGVGALLHGLLDTIVDGHFETIQLLDDEIEDLEDELFSAGPVDGAFVQRVYRFRKDLVGLRRVVLPMREVVNALVRHRDRDGTDLDHWYDDLYDHVLRAAEWTESLRDLVSTVFEANLSLQDSRLNVIMKKLAGWGAIIAIPTAVTGWFGQNIPYPGFASPLGLWLSIALIVVLSGGLYLMFRHLRWL
ncbi:MAG: magnesium transporter CorA family protein [Tetrasphaera sp.]